MSNLSKLHLRREALEYAVTLGHDDVCELLESADAIVAYLEGVDLKETAADRIARAVYGMDKPA